MSNVVKQVRVTRTDDIDGTDGAETVTFALDGQTWEIDLGQKNRAKLIRGLAPFVAAARRTADSGSASTGTESAEGGHARGPEHSSHTRERRMRSDLSPGRIPRVTNAVSPSRTDIYDIADRLWETADELRANSHLKAGEYSIPVLGLIFLKFADSRFSQVEAELAGTGSGRRTIGKADYQARGVLYLPEQSRFAKLLRLTEGKTLAGQSTTRWPA